VRTFKGKKAYCPEKKCHYSKAGFDIRVQQEVDVAIAMMPIKSIYKHPNLKTLVLLTGDGDFHDMVEFMKDTHNVKVIVACWSASINNALREMVNEVVYLDNIWQEFSYPKGNNITAMNNLELLKHLGFSDSVSAAANHRYPNPEDKENAIEFAI